MNRFLSIIVALFCSPALAQNGAPVKQGGNVTPTHVGAWTTNGVLQDGGTAAIPFLTSIGTVYNGPSICAWSALSTSGAAQELCLGATNAGGATITVQNFGSATALPLSLSLNGTIYQFPFSTSGVIGPVTTIINDGACWGNTTGTLLKECAPLVLLNGTSNGVWWKNVSGTPDASIAESSGNSLLIKTPSATNTGVITDSLGNPMLTMYGEQPSNGAWSFNLTSGHCGIGDEDLTVTGTPTATEQPGFTYTIGSTTATVTYTVQPGDTNNSIATGLAAAAQANTIFKSLVNGTCPDGNTYNGAITAVFLGNAQMGFDPIWSANPTAGGNSFSGINSTHTTITTFPINELTGALYRSDNSFVAGRNAAVNDNPFQYQLLYQDSTGASAVYWSETVLAHSVTPGATTPDVNWSFGGVCAYDWLVNTGQAFFEASAGCDLNLVANDSTTNNVNVATGSAGAINLRAGSGGVIAGNGTIVGQYCVTNATSGSICLKPPTGALGTQTLTLPDATDTLTGKATTDTLTNKTIVSSTDTLGGVTMGLGSDATGDIYYRNSGGQLARLPIGSTNQQLAVAGGLPAWTASTNSMAYLCTITASNSTSLNNASPTSGSCPLNGTYTSYELRFHNIVPASNEKILEIQVHSSGSYQATGYITSQNFCANSTCAGGNPTTYIPLSYPSDANAAALQNAAPGFTGTVTITTPSISGLISVVTYGGYLDGGGLAGTSTGFGYWNTPGVVDGFQVLMDSGNIASGSIFVYGIQ
jgi:hypothetical protein